MLPVDIPAAIQPFWRAFRATRDVDPTPRFYEAFHFGDGEALANLLADLVIAGRKRATTSLLWTFEADSKPLPPEGSLSVVTRWDGSPLCVIETRRVAVMPFEEVPESFAVAEGEGDGTLQDWRAAHWAYFARECARLGREPGEKMPVVCEEFAVVSGSTRRALSSAGEVPWQ